MGNQIIIGKKNLDLIIDDEKKGVEHLTNIQEFCNKLNNLHVLITEDIDDIRNNSKQRDIILFEINITKNTNDQFKLEFSKRLSGKIEIYYKKHFIKELNLYNEMQKNFSIYYNICRQMIQDNSSNGFPLEILFNLRNENTDIKCSYKFYLSRQGKEKLIKLLKQTISNFNKALESLYMHLSNS